MEIISLGAGVQSSTLLLMACHGEIEPKPNYAVFSDTGWEPVATYKYLEWLTIEAAKHGITVITTNKGNIKEDIIQSAKTGQRMASIPFFVKDDSGTVGMVHRQCTKEYKIMPVRNKIRAMLGYKPRQAIKKQISLYMGISLDEIERVKPSMVKWVRNRYPLIEKEMTRQDCINWLQSKGYPVPPKSSCIGCPFHNNHMWREMKMNDPQSWADAVAIDKKIRNHPRLKGKGYLHRSGMPLDEVYLQEDQIDMFANECEGYCGT